MALELVTKPGGKVSAKNDADVRRGAFGDVCVLGFGEKMRYEIINNNTIRVYDGVMMVQGMQVQIKPNTYEDFIFDNGTQGVTQYDIFGFEVTTGASTYTIKKFVKENVGQFGTATEKDLWNASSGTTTQAGLYRVKFEGLSIVEVVPLFEVLYSMSEINNMLARLNNSIYADGYVFVDCGSLPNAGETVTAIDLPDGATEWWISDAWFKNPQYPNKRYPLPYIEVSYWDESVGIMISNNRSVMLTTKADWRGYYAYAVVAYKL